ncbi:hypothetical protein CAPTEDRAFT_199550, partial [Capitella teleta]
MDDKKTQKEMGREGKEKESWEVGEENRRMLKQLVITWSREVNMSKLPYPRTRDLQHGKIVRSAKTIPAMDLKKGSLGHLFSIRTRFLVKTVISGVIMVVTVSMVIRVIMVIMVIRVIVVIMVIRDIL